MPTDRKKREKGRKNKGTMNRKKEKQATGIIE